MSRTGYYITEESDYACFEGAYAHFTLDFKVFICDVGYLEYNATCKNNSVILLRCVSFRGEITKKTLTNFIT